MTTWTLLETVKEFAKRQNVKIPISVVTSTDEQILQAWGLLNEEAAELATRGPWPQLTKTMTFQHARGPDYLAFSFDDSSLKYMFQCTLWSTDRQLYVQQVTDQQWNEILANQVVPSDKVYRLAGEGIEIYPAPGEADEMYQFTAKYKNHIRSSDGTTIDDRFNADDDVGLLPGDLYVTGLRWRWRMEKGLPYAEHFRMYEGMVLNYLSAATNAPEVRLDQEDSQGPWPGIMIPASNWPLP